MKIIKQKWAKGALTIHQLERCTQFLFSVSLNPPQDEIATNETFEKALTDIEHKMGLEGQPRVVVFHEKEGRRHAHCVWSRIDAQSMTAINLPFYKKKLNEISKGIYLEQGWNMPKGFIDKQYTNPLNFTREEWQHSFRDGGMRSVFWCSPIEKPRTHYSRFLRIGMRF